MFQAITPQNFVSGRHCDTYGIASSPQIAIRIVSDVIRRVSYHARMAKFEYPWEDWGRRFRVQIKEREVTLAKVAEKMGLAEVTLRSWTNGTRDANLADVFRMCEVAGVDPAIVLLGRPVMTETQRKSMGELATKIMEVDPTANPNYAVMGDKIRKTVRARKAAEARAASRLKL